MGRIFEALKQGAPARRVAPVTTTQVVTAVPERRAAPAPEEAPSSDSAAMPTGFVDEIPFIEVGGPGRILEASPEVLHAAVGFWRPGGPRTRNPGGGAGISVPETLAAGDLVSLTFRALAAARPEDRFGRELVAFHDAAHPLAEQYRALWSSLAESLAGQSPQALLFAGFGSVTCKTTVVLNLAITCAREEKRTLAVELVASSPSVGRRLGLPERPGLADVLAGRAALSDAIQETGLANFQVLTAGQGAGAVPPEGLESVLQPLRSKFDLVLVDGLAWEAEPASIEFMAAFDAAYAVVRQKEAGSAAIDDVLRRVSQRGVRLAGCVLTNP
jgi:Mrp family chromosome partitioning ATPase